MKVLSSAEFRKTYPRLEEAVAVTVLGHIIGHYIPATVAMPEIDPHPADQSSGGPMWYQDVGSRPAQSKRDAILRKINKGG
jgi:hypothetical protein